MSTRSLRLKSSQTKGHLVLASSPTRRRMKQAINAVLPTPPFPQITENVFFCTSVKLSSDESLLVATDEFVSSQPREFLDPRFVVELLTNELYGGQVDALGNSRALEPPDHAEGRRQLLDRLELHGRSAPLQNGLKGLLNKIRRHVRGIRIPHLLNFPGGPIRVQFETANGLFQCIAVGAGDRDRVLEQYRFPAVGQPFSIRAHESPRSEFREHGGGTVKRTVR